MPYRYEREKWVLEFLGPSQSGKSGWGREEIRWRKWYKHAFVFQTAFDTLKQNQGKFAHMNERCPTCRHTLKNHEDLGWSCDCVCPRHEDRRLYGAEWRMRNPSTGDIIMGWVL